MIKKHSLDTLVPIDALVTRPKRDKPRFKLDAARVARERVAPLGPKSFRPVGFGLKHGARGALARCTAHQNEWD